MADRTSKTESVEPTVSEERAVRNNPAGAAAIIKRQQADIERLQGQLQAMTDRKDAVNEALAKVVAERNELRSRVETKADRPFQYRVVGWALDCFGSEDTADRAMRTYRFLEEALELAQACGCTKDAAARVLEYVYGRPTGVIKQEAGGTMVSLAVLCEAFGFGMDEAGEAELARVLGKIEHIRARHAAKPDFSSPVKSIAPPASDKCEHGIPRRFCTAVHEGDQS